MDARAQSQAPMRRVRPVERQPMIEWLTELLNSGEVTSLTWTDQSKREFKIKWCHGSRHGWSMRDAELFERWAKHTGRYLFGGKKDPKRWKANFRCALNSLKTIEEVRDRSQVRGSNAFRVYRMVDVPKKESKYTRDTRQAVNSNRKPMAPQGIKMEENSSDGTNSDSNGSTSEIEEVYNRQAELTSKPPLKQEKTGECRLPNFDKISPGIDKIEFGKMHCLPKHSCGFTVKQGNGKSTRKPMSSAGHVTISLPESFQRQISDSGSTGQPETGSYGPQFKRVVFPESPEASDDSGSPISASQDQEMVEINFYEVPEVTISSSEHDSQDMLTDLGLSPENRASVSELVDLIINSGQDQNNGSNFIQQYAPLTPPY